MSQHRRPAPPGQPGVAKALRAGRAPCHIAALALLDAGLWPVPIRPGEKGPIGKAWGARRQDAASLADAFRRDPGAGVGVCLGPGRGPGGSWLADVEGDGPEAEASRVALFGGEVVESRGWSSCRGAHQLVALDGERIAALLPRLKGWEGKGVGAGVYKSPELPGLELRIGGHKADGAVKQLQSVVPPTPGTDGKPRVWTGPETIAAAPEAFYATLERLAPKAPPRPPEAPPRGGGVAYGSGRWTPEMRAIAYLDTCEPAISQRGGHNKTFGVACRVGPGFDLDPSTALRLLLEHYNPRCDPPWTEAEIRHKVDDAYANEDRRGWLLNAERRNGAVVGHAEIRTLAATGTTGAVAMARPEPEPDDGPSDDVVDNWPTIGGGAFYGLAGEIVEAIMPHVEGDPAAVLAQLLCAFGNAVSTGPFVAVGAGRHPPLLNVAVVGRSGSGRKGSGHTPVRELMLWMDESWAKDRWKSGLVSGEGLIFNVRDATFDKEGEIDDPGEPDKRLLIVEEELSRPLKAMARDGNTTSDVIRKAWDAPPTLATLAKNSPNRASNPRISIIGHITTADLKAHFSNKDCANGFGNRFLWICSRASKDLPEGGEFFAADWNPYVERLRAAQQHALGLAAVRRDAEAAELWRERYADLNQDRPGLLGTMLGRAAPQVLRLSLVYALLDSSREIRADHLLAALALWDYAEASARFIFGEDLGDPKADKLIKAIRSSPDGLTRKHITKDVFGSNLKKDQIGALLTDLLSAGMIHRIVSHPPVGRPVERWVAGRGNRATN